MSESYQLETIADLAKIPPDRLSACLRDLEYAIQMTHFVAGEQLSEFHGFDSFVWTDDSNHSVNVSLNGEPLCSLVVTDESTPEGER
jgi:hypothetical protein